MTSSPFSISRRLALLSAAVLSTPSVFAVNVRWADWTQGNPTAGTAAGTITTATTTVSVTYNNPQGYAFIQTGTGTDYFQNGGDINRSPYTSSVVDNDPTAAEMIGLFRAGMQTLSFSQTVANPFFSYVSLNGNGYAFDRDFDILSFGDGVTNDPGFWGAGTSFKQVVDLGGGNFEYRLLGTGEPHGTIRFIGTFDTVSWRSLSNENWNGFTVGVEGTAQEVHGTPDSGSTLMMLGAALGGIAWMKRRKNTR